MFPTWQTPENGIQGESSSGPQVNDMQRLWESSSSVSYTKESGLSKILQQGENGGLSV